MSLDDSSISLGLERIRECSGAISNACILHTDQVVSEKLILSGGKAASKEKISLDEFKGCPQDEVEANIQGKEHEFSSIAQEHRPKEAVSQEEFQDFDMSKRKRKNWWKRFVNIRKSGEGNVRSKLNAGTNKTRRIKVKQNKKRWLHMLQRGVAKVVVKKGKTKLFKDGNPMVYSGAVDRIIGRPPPKTGDVILVADGTEKPIGWGMYNSVSMFCVRLMQFEDEATRTNQECASWLGTPLINKAGVLLLGKDYPYASDGLEIWDAIKSRVEEYVSFYYKSDEELQKDPELQAWWKELVEVGHGDLKDKPWWQKMQTREELVEASATLIWIASALHAAVNFGQHTSDEFYLGQRDGGDYWTSDAGPLEAFKRFGNNLEEIEKKLIEKNNDETLRNRYGPAKMPYTLLYPSSEEGLTFRGIPKSISI
ncbi:Linoleate 9S-lipoxygenase [Glycine soja]